MTKIGGPIFGSVFASFPAVYLSTLIVINKSVGNQFFLSMTMPMMISGMFNVVMFSIIFRFLVLELNFIFSIAIAYFASIIIAFLIYNYTQLYR
jgi:cytochrome c biogenesis factor